MPIKDLQAKQGQVDLIAEVIEKGDIREFEKFGRKGRVCSARVKDGSGEMILSLWNEQIDMVKVGNKIHIINGYVSEWQGEKQLTTGRFGQLEVIEEGETTDETEKTEDLGEKEIGRDKEKDTLSEDEEFEEGFDEKTEEDIIKDEEEIK